MQSIFLVIEGPSQTGPRLLVRMAPRGSINFQWIRHDGCEVKFVENSGVPYLRGGEEGHMRRLLFETREQLGRCHVFATMNPATAVRICRHGFPRIDPTLNT